VFSQLLDSREPVTRNVHCNDPRAMDYPISLKDKVVMMMMIRVVSGSPGFKSRLGDRLS
jgi:hypothetical protein